MMLPRLGAGWMVLAGVLFATMGLFVQLAGRQHNAAELVFYRSLFSLLALLAASHVGAGRLATPHWRLHVLRSLSGFLAIMLFFVALTELPLATAITLNNTAPLFLALLTLYVLREREHGALAPFVLAAGFIGVVLLLQPDFGDARLLVSLGGLLSGLLAAVAYHGVRSLGRVGEPEYRTVFWFALTCTTGAALWMLGAGMNPPTLASSGQILAMGLTGTLAQLAMTRAWREGRPMVVASLGYTSVVAASLLGLLLLDEQLSPERWAGIAIIVLAGILSAGATRPPGRETS